MQTQGNTDETIKTLNVRLVDDDPVFHLINTSALKHIGIKSIGSTFNGQEALEWISENAMPDVVFVDLDMPVINGFAFIESLQKISLAKQHEICIVILTSSSNPTDKERAERLGLSVSRYLVKPLNENTARNTLEQFSS